MIPAAVGAAVKLAPVVAGLFGGKRRHTGLGRLNQEYLDYQPTGRLNPEDYAAADATRNRLASAATVTAGHQRGAVHRRYLQRGIGGPAEEASLARVGETEAAGREQAGETANEQLYNVRLGRERDAQARAGQVYSTRVGAIYSTANRDAVRQSAFINSLMEYVPNLRGLFTHGGGGGVLDTNDPGYGWGGGSDLAPLKP